MSGASKGAGKAESLQNFFYLSERVLQTVAVEACDHSFCTISVQTRQHECSSTANSIAEEKQCVMVLYPSVPHS